MEASSNSHYLGHWVKVVNHSQMVASNRILEPHGLTVSSWYILYHVNDSTQISQKQLQKILGIESGSMAILVDGLVRKGWIERTQDDKDRRANNLKLTSKGFARWKKVPDFVEILREKMMKGVTKEEEASVVKILKRCWENLNLENSD
jgi:DNA-binding MarR family transcriptional regulator